jgi:hypothetical protein
LRALVSFRLLLALLVAVWIGGVLGSQKYPSFDRRLTAADMPDVKAALARLTPPPDFQVEAPCPLTGGLCFKRPSVLRPSSAAGVVALARRFGLAAVPLPPGSCLHILSPSLTCHGFGYLGRFEAIFFVNSIDSPNPRMARLRGTSMRIAIVRALSY